MITFPTSQIQNADLSHGSCRVVAIGRHPKPSTFATEVAQLKCPHLPAADIEGPAR